MFYHFFIKPISFLLLSLTSRINYYVHWIRRKKRTISGGDLGRNFSRDLFRYRNFTRLPEKAGRCTKRFMTRATRVSACFYPIFDFIRVRIIAGGSDIARRGAVFLRACNLGPHENPAHVVGVILLL